MCEVLGSRPELLEQIKRGEIPPPPDFRRPEASPPRRVALRMKAFRASPRGTEFDDVARQMDEWMQETLDAHDGVEFRPNTEVVGEYVVWTIFYQTTDLAPEGGLKG